MTTGADKHDLLFPRISNLTVDTPRGNVGVILFNHSNLDFVIQRGDRIAQLILEIIALPDVVEVDELDDTERGTGGYGSTGR